MLAWFSLSPDRRLFGHVADLIHAISDTISLARVANLGHTSSVNRFGLRTESGKMEAVIWGARHMKATTGMVSAIADPGDMIDLQTPSIGRRGLRILCARLPWLGGRAKRQSTRPIVRGSLWRWGRGNGTFDPANLQHFSGFAKFCIHSRSHGDSTAVEFRASRFVHLVKWCRNPTYQPNVFFKYSAFS